ncbi:hypothetical protein MSA03_24710 [Microbacterium saccharophilum]|uniref:DUF4190 domain-containing protein n=1 Tax=Microbacterium saccharophilum TaxID=1213358 RepID=UPI0011970352|nr:DUF4190 domain-containing protein [Microbacterium saccharophilum]GEP48963.1 hypothetical protein MSA03_24710 [Microbacterium saccharophilum]
MSEPTPQPQNTQPPAAPPAYVPPAYPPAAQTPPYAAPGAYQPPAYPGTANPYAYGGYAAAQKTNTLSIVSLIASIAGFIWILPFVGSLAGAIMGHIALNQIKQTGEKGRGMALAGVIVGWAGLALVIIGVIIFFGLIAVAGSTTGFSTS